MKNKDIIFRDTISLRGPSIWTYPPAIETWIDIGELEDFPPTRFPASTNALPPGCPA
jgi:cyanophycin synthetase